MEYYGKKKCRILKQIRAEIAKNNGIDWVVEECPHKGNCRGTCPKCEEEVRELERQLAARRKLGKAIAVTGVAAGIALAVSGCGEDKNTTVQGNIVADPGSSVSEQKIEEEPYVLEGDVEAPREDDFDGTEDIDDGDIFKGVILDPVDGDDGTQNGDGSEDKGDLEDEGVSSGEDGSDTTVLMGKVIVPQDDKNENDGSDDDEEPYVLEGDVAGPVDGEDEDGADGYGYSDDDLYPLAGEPLSGDEYEND
ncbi:MAG: hypothetical protein J5912_02085 [Clostridia bacterium]|nr:hypothetical protein [Clostridia bacterium]